MEKTTSIRLASKVVSKVRALAKREGRTIAATIERLIVKALASK